MPSSRMWHRVYRKGWNFSLTQTNSIFRRGFNTTTWTLIPIPDPFFTISLHPRHLIVKHHQDVNVSGGYYVAPMGAALAGKHLHVAKLLYQHGANVDVPGKHEKLYCDRYHWRRA
ncbi:hypothetical protein BGW80DRAFT_1353843 [Lactifluus volemus]|nr:hypothetical protein BGW80DRAFT_1353843 [Lactifluus volemus]